MTVHGLAHSRSVEITEGGLLRPEMNSWPFHTDPFHQGMELSRFSDIAQKVL